MRVTQAREIEAQNKLRDARQALREITGKLIDKLRSRCARHFRC